MPEVREAGAPSTSGAESPRFWLDAVRAEELLARHGSPLYVYNAEGVRERYRAFKAAFPYEPLDLHYAIVCNKNLYLVRELFALGAGVHANTPGDAFAALAAGVPEERIVYSGTNLNAADFEFLAAHKVGMNLDSLDQLRDWAGRAKGLPAPLAGKGRDLGLRFLIDDEGRGNRIGVTLGELGEAVTLARAAGLSLSGLHMYVATNNNSAERFLACFKRLLEASAQIPDLEYLNLGGGYGVGYREGQSELDLSSIGAEVAREMESLSTRRGRKVRLILEPGRTLVASAGALLLTVVAVKERGGRRFVGVDSTVGNIVVEDVYYPHHRVAVLNPRGARLEIPTDLCGNTTHSRDFLGRGLHLPALAPGDRLVLCDVGAYGYAMSSHFLNRPRPAEVVLDGRDAHLTTRRESFDDLLATQTRQAGAP